MTSRMFFAAIVLHNLTNVTIITTERRWILNLFVLKLEMPWPASVPYPEIECYSLLSVLQHTVCLPPPLNYFD